MLDILDILMGRFSQTNPGTYYDKIPEAMLYTSTVQELYDATGVGVPMDYEIVDPTEWHYKSLLGNIMDGDGATATIKTCDQLDYKVGGNIITSDGKMYVISSVTRDTRAVPKEAMRIFPIPIGTEFVLRLTEMDNKRRTL